MAAGHASIPYGATPHQVHQGRTKKDRPTVPILAEGTPDAEIAGLISAAEDKVAKWELGHELAVNAIQSRLGNNLLSDLESQTNACLLWEAIIADNKPKGSGTLNDLYRQLLKLDLGQCKDASDFAARLKGIHTDITNVSPKLKLETNFLIFLFHTGLGKAYDAYFTHYIQNHKPMNEANTEPAFSLEYATTRFIQTVTNPSSERTESSYAFAAQRPRRPAPNNSGPVTTIEPQKGAVPGPDSRMIQKRVKYCTHCKKHYHTKTECDQLSGKSRNKGTGGGNNGGNTRDDDSKSNDKKDKDGDHKPSKKRRRNSTDTERETCVAYTAESDSSPMRWALDCACSQHSTPHRDAFIEYRLLDPAVDDVRPIKGIKDSLVPIGIGKVCLSTVTDGKKKELILTNVLHLPGLPLNLVSQGQLMRNGLPMKFVPNGIEIGHRGITAWLQENNLYTFRMWESKSTLVSFKAEPMSVPVPKQHGTKFAMLQATPKHKEKANPVNGGIPAPAESDTSDSNSDSDSDGTPRKINEETLNLWHARMGHLGHQNIRKLAGLSKGMDLTKKVVGTEPCAPCAIKKAKNAPHKSHIRPGERSNDLIHSDICGPITPRGFGGGKYFITFLDDYDKRSEVEVIERKSDAFAAFKRFQLRNEHGDFTVRRLRSDYGGEYEDYGFDIYRADHGITWEPVQPGNPEQNGAAERLGQTLFSTVSTVIEDTGIDWKFWPELVMAANYLRNRSPITGRKLTPYEAHTGCKPRLAHIRRIGTKGFATMRRPATGWKKGQHRAREGVLVGYDGDHIYRMLLPDGSIIRSSKVIWGREKNGLLPDPIPPQSPNDPAMGGNAPRPMAPPSAGNFLPVDAMDVDELIQSSRPVPRPSEPAETPSDSGAGTPIVTPRSTPTVQGDAPLYPNHPYLIPRNLSPDPLALYAMVAQAANTEPYEPKTYKEATANNSSRKQWKGGMTEEFESLEENDTWALVDLPHGRTALRGRWVYTLKRGPNGEVTRYKARWVVRGFEQREGLDYNETFASVVKPMSYKAIFALAAAEDWDLEQMDVKTAFLYGDVEEEIYVEQPTGFASEKYPRRVCKLNKALYGLKQSPRVWYNTFADYMREIGLVPIDADYSVFTDPDTGTIVALYVDDVLVTGPSRPDIQRIKDALNAKFKMSDLGPCSYYLGMTVTRDRTNRTLRLGQSAYIERFLRHHGMWESKPQSTPMETSARPLPAEDGYTASAELLKTYQSAVGSLMYAMLGTRPDIAFAVSVVSRYSSNPTEAHYAAVKRIFRYLRATIHWHLTYKGPLQDLIGYTDSDWAGDHDTRRSTSGYIYNLGSGAISWSSKRQATVALSTCEAEYIGQTQAAKEAIWLRGLLSQIRPNGPLQTVIIFGDNQGAIALAKNPQHHGRVKHIDIQHHWVRGQIADGNVDLKYISTDKQVADGLTKALCRDKFELFRELIGLEPRP